MYLSNKVFNALYDLIRRNAQMPGAFQTITPAILAQYAKQSSEDCRLAMSIMQQVPPHADKDPSDMEDLLAQAAKRFTSQQG